MACGRHRALAAADHHHRGDAAGIRGDGGVAGDQAGDAERLPLGPGRRCCGRSAGPPIRARGAGPGVGRSMSCSISVTCSAGTPISITSIPSEASSTRWRISGGWMKQSPAMQPPLRALILVDHVDPALDAEDQLEADLVEMHHVGHRAAVGDADMAGDDRAAEPRGDQVAVLHPGAADHPGRLIGEPADDEGMFGRRLHHRRVERADLDAWCRPARSAALRRRRSAPGRWPERRSAARAGRRRFPAAAAARGPKAPPPAGCRRARSVPAASPAAG